MEATERDAGLVQLLELDEAWRVAGHGAKLSAVRRAAESVRARLKSGRPALGVRTLPLTTLAYPTKFAFWSHALSPAPFIQMTHRCLLVQFQQRGERKTLLFNPSDIERAKATPYFAKIIAQVGPVAKLLAKYNDPIEAQLAAQGLTPDDVDYVAFDHFHTQDLRGLLGTTDGALRARFPRARLLAPRSEWNEWDSLHPMQRAWFVAEGRRGVREERVLLTDGDLLLGDGVALLRTPGHTSGNQTLFMSTDRGIWGCSENGVCVDNWAPHASRIPGLASSAKLYEVDFVLNANTPEGGATQYTAMALEEAMVDRALENPDFPQMFSSSEATPAAYAPMLSPTLLHREITHGAIERAKRSADSAVAVP